MKSGLQTWQKGDDTVYLEKNHGQGDTGYFVDVQGSMEIKKVLENKFNGLFEGASCQWNDGSNLAGLPGTGKVLTIRTQSMEIQGAKLLELVGLELEKLGYAKVE